MHNKYENVFCILKQERQSLSLRAKTVQTAFVFVHRTSDK